MKHDSERGINALSENLSRKLLSCLRKSFDVRTMIKLWEVQKRQRNESCFGERLLSWIVKNLGQFCCGCLAANIFRTSKSLVWFLKF